MLDPALVIHSDSATRRLLQDELGALGVPSTAVERPDDALQLLPPTRFSLIVFGLDGDPANDLGRLTRLRKTPQAHEAPVIVVRPECSPLAPEVAALTVHAELTTPLDRRRFREIVSALSNR